jgi:alkylation response protein AidB-like acyl-CoA dehydrogenase
MSSSAPFQINLDEDHTEIREGVRRICIDFPGGYWQELDQLEHYPTDFVKAMTEAGFLSALIPETYGGAGLPLRAAGVVLEEIHASGGNAAATHAQMYTMGTVLRHGSEAQKRKYLPEIAAGRLRLQAFGVTEPTSGTDTTQLKTRAVRDGDHYVINGQKVWTSRALHSDLMLLLARTTPLDQVKKRTEGLSVFLIDMREAQGHGMTIRPIKTMINHNTTEVFFDNLRIPADTLVGTEGQGLRHIMDGMNAERILISHESIGDSKWFIKTAVAYANQRIIFQRPIGQNQGIQFPIAKAYAQQQAADLMVRKASAMFEAGLHCGEEANLSKLLSAEAAWEAAEACMQTHGGFAYACEYNIERKWREARVLRTAPISTNMILSYIAEHVLGLPRSY